MFNNIRSLKPVLTIALLLLLLSTQAFAQATGSLSGTVRDASKAVMPGVTITASNVDTGIAAKATTNNSGNYTFAGLQPGTYSITAEAPGFTGFTAPNVRVRLGENSLNIDMRVSGGVETVEVVADGYTALLESGASSGTVIQEDMLVNLPILSGNVLDLVNQMSGVVQAEDPLWGAEQTTFAGVPASAINIQRDGITVNEIRYNSGIATPSRMNQEMIGEFRMILSPVDAEMGRGAGQIQMTTRSGANAFHGSAVWNVQNTALDALEWETKTSRTSASAPDWRNLNNYTLTLSGPIIKNKTFFFATWDQQISRTRAYVQVGVLTMCARKGIYRYLTDVGSMAASAVPTAPAVRGIPTGEKDEDGNYILRASWGMSRPGVNSDGSPRLEYTWDANNSNLNAIRNTSTYAGGEMPLSAFKGTWDFPNNTTEFVGDDDQIRFNLAGRTERQKLVYDSVLGPLSDELRRNLGGYSSTDDYGGPEIARENSWVFNGCPEDGTYDLADIGDYTYGGGWDRYRAGLDKSQFAAKFGKPQYMPEPNDFIESANSADGLNRANYGWTRSASGQDTVFGTVYDSNRKAISTRIDHNINYAHRLSGTYSYESNTGDDAGNLRQIADGYAGSTDRKPQSFTITLTSTIKPTLMNEFRMGLSRTASRTNNSLTNPKTGGEVRKALLDMVDTSNKELWPYYSDVVLAGPAGYTLPYFWGSAVTATWGGVDPRWTFNDTVTWMKGAHSFRGGFEYRMHKSVQEQNGEISFTPSNMFPRINGGAGTAYAPWSIGALSDPDNPSMGGKGPLTGLDGRIGDGKTTRSEMWGGSDLENNSIPEYQRCDRNNAGYGVCTGTGTVLSNAYTLMSYMSGSVDSISQYFYVEDANNPRWNEPGNGELEYTTDLRGREFHFFFKDDWRITNDLTLNLGVRYEYYGVPWVADGRAAGLKDDINGAYGISRGLGWMPDIETLMDPTKNPAHKAWGDDNYKALGTEQIFIGPGSSNPDVPVFKKDLNNWAPHVGFAWQLPWFGRGKTTLRGGYSISYSAIGNYDSTFGYGGILAHAPGMDYPFTFSGSDLDYGSPYGTCSQQLGQPDGVCYMDFSNVGQLLPLTRQLPSNRIPMGGVDKDGVSYADMIRPSSGTTGGGVTVYDPNVRNPYTQNINLSVTRNIGNVLTLDVRYIGTLSRKSVSGLSVNTTNWINNGLFGEISKLRAGIGDLKSAEDFPILNSGIIPFKRGAVEGTSPYYVNQAWEDSWNTASLYAQVVGGVLVDDLSGAEQFLYQNWMDIGRGNFQAAVSALQSANYDSDLTSATTTRTEDQLRLPGLRTGEGGGQVLRYGGAPSNLLVSNPQYTPTINRNQGRSNYHSMQIQVTLRPIRGLSFQSSYTWSRSLARGSVLDWTDPNWTMDYGLSGSHRSHTFNSYGTYELPFGARGFFFRDVTGWAKKAIEGWQVSWIGTASSGLPMSFNGVANTMWNNNKWVQVGPFDTKDVAVRWNKDAAQGSGEGTYFNKTYVGVPDPQCASALVADISNPYGGSGLRQMCRDGDQFFNVGMTAMALDKTGSSATPYVPTYDPERHTLIFQNPLPGEIGNTQSNTLTGPGRWNLDMTLAKSIEFMEGKRFELRIDAQNIFNHPTPSYDTTVYNLTFGNPATYTRAKQVMNPTTQMPYASFSPTLGLLNSKAGHRTFQARLRLSF